MSKTKAAVLSLPLFMSALALHAQQPAADSHSFSYTYGQLGFEHWDYDGGLDIDAANAEGALALSPNLFARGSLSLYDGDVDRGRFRGNDDTDGYRLSAGLGYHTPLAQRLDLVVSGDIIRDDHDHDDELGFAVRGGVRHATTDRLELSGGLFYEDIYSDEVGLYGEALYQVNRPIDVGARINLSDDLTSLGVFARYNF